MPVMPVLGRQWGALGTDPKSVGTATVDNGVPWGQTPKAWGPQIQRGQALYMEIEIRDSLIPRILVNIRLRVLNLKKS